MKRCSKCKQTFAKTEFYRAVRRRDGLHSWCKTCVRSDSARYAVNHQEEIKQRRAAHYKKNRTRLRQICTTYYQENKEAILQRQANQRQLPAAKVATAARDRVWHQTHKKQIRQRVRRRRATDLQFRLRSSLRSRLRKAIRGCYKTGSAVRDLGCSVDEFVAYIATLFQPGMSWANWGEWHLDHIKPLASFDLAKREQLLLACHFTNMQPLWAEANFSKGAALSCVSTAS